MIAGYIQQTGIFERCVAGARMYLISLKDCFLLFAIRKIIRLFLTHDS